MARDQNFYSRQPKFRLIRIRLNRSQIIYIYTQRSSDFDKNSTQPEIRVNRIRDNGSQLYIFNHGIYPDFWTECLVIPVPKSGDLSDPNNYRPIVLVSVLSKLFTSILTERLLSWSEDEDKLIDNQF